MGEVTYKFSVGQTVKLAKEFKPTNSVTLPAGTRGRVTRIVTRKVAFKHKCPYDVKWEGFDQTCPMKESELRAG